MIRHSLKWPTLSALVTGPAIPLLASQVLLGSCVDAPDMDNVAQTEILQVEQATVLDPPDFSWPSDGTPPRQSEGVPGYFVEPPPDVTVWEHSALRASLAAGSPRVSPEALVESLLHGTADSVAVVEATQVGPLDRIEVRTPWRLDAYLRNAAGLEYAIGETFLVLQRAGNGDAVAVTSSTVKGSVGMRALLFIERRADVNLLNHSDLAGPGVIYLTNSDRAVLHSGPELSADGVRDLVRTMTLPPSQNGQDQNQ